MATLLNDIVSALQATNHFGTVGTRADHANALTMQERNREALPAVYVMPPDDEPGANRLAAGGVSQKVTQTFDLVIGISNLSDPTNTGAAAVDELEAAKFKVRGALHGKVLGAADPYCECPNPLLYASGYKLGYSQSLFWYLVQYSVDVYYQSP